MAVDYDLIVMGGAPIGRKAARQARQLGARVALIEPPDLPDAALAFTLLIEINRAIRQARWLSQWSAVQLPSLEVDWAKTRHWLKALAETFEISQTYPTSLTRLMTAGVDVIVADGAFCQGTGAGARWRPGSSWGIAVGERVLRSRAYLLTPQATATVPAIAGLDRVRCATCTDWVDHWPTLPRHLLILGLDPRGLLLAQLLNRLGTEVTLLTSYDRLLPNPEHSALLQAQLEAEGVTVLSRTQVMQVSQGSQIQVQISRGPSDLQILETEAILLATSPRLDLDALKLTLAGVNWRPTGIIVNARLQTSQPRIYACGEALGRYASPARDQHQLDIALHNALFWPPKATTTTAMPTGLPTDPPFSWVGLTAGQAQQRYGAAVQTGRVKSPQGWLDAGFQLIAHQDGRLLGAYGVGADACDAVSLVALAMQQNLKLKALAAMPTADMPAAELIRQASAQFQRPEWQRELLETWLNLWRAR